MGPDVKLFEQEVTEYLGVKQAIALNRDLETLGIGLGAIA